MQIQKTDLKKYSTDQDFFLNAQNQLYACAYRKYKNCVNNSKDVNKLLC